MSYNNNHDDNTRSTAICHDNPSKLVGTRMSPFWILLRLSMMEVVVTTGAIRRAKLQIVSINKQARCPSYYPTNSIKALIIHILS